MPAWSINKTVRTPLLLLGIAELAILFLSVYAAAIILFGDLQLSEKFLGPLLPKAVIVSAVMLVSLIATGLYQFHQRVFFHEVLIRVIVAVSGSGLVLAALFYLVPTIRMPLDMAIVSAFAASSLLLLLRYIFVRNVDDNMFRHRSLIYGAGERSSAISGLRRRADRRGFKIVGVLPAPGDSQKFDHSDLVEKNGSLLELAERVNADEIVIAMDDRRGNLPIRELLDCKLRGINVVDLVEFLERETGKIRIDLVNPGWLIFSPGFRVGLGRRVVKRLIDVTLSAVVFAVSWPVMLIIALLIKLEDGANASVFYRQQRVGLHGDTFDVLKFRSMIENAEADGKAVWAEENDSRVTRVGAKLRKFRLDELPQVFNVLKGEMSLVGPRPERPQFVRELEESIPYYSERHTVKPGVTGWAQLKYSYGSSEEDAAEKLQYDLYYVKNQNFLLDLVIVLQTVEVILWSKGAR